MSGRVLHFPGGSLDVSSFPEKNSGISTFASAEELAAWDAEGDRLELAQADTERPKPVDWRDCVRVAADALPDCTPFRACGVSLRAVLADPEHAEAQLSDALHWLSGCLETLDAFGIVLHLGAVEAAYDAVEAALDGLGLQRTALPGWASCGGARSSEARPCDAQQSKGPSGQ